MIWSSATQGTLLKICIGKSSCASRVAESVKGDGGGSAFFMSVRVCVCVGGAEGRGE